MTKDQRQTTIIIILILMVLLAFLVQLLVFPAHAGAIAPGSVNNLSKTPGDVLTTSKVKICHQKTSTIRNVPMKVKNQAYANYGITRTTGWCATKGCEVDHLISLELGGSNSIKNLWPQSYAGKWNARVKDKLENRLHVLICNGTLTPVQAQRAISHNWIIAYNKYVR
jgi:hypothetical protein